MKFFALVICLMFSFLSEVKTEERRPALIPLPAKCELLKGKFTLSKKTFLQNEASKLDEYLITQIKQYTQIQLSTSAKNSANKILLRIDKQNNYSSDEAYNLTVSKHQIEITAADDKGLFRGMQTLFQLIPPSVKSKKQNMVVEIPCCNIADKPAFVWRGLNLDCGRHFMTKDFIKRYIDILAYYKFNTLHWHLTEDQGWRIEIKKYPKLTQIGAWRKEADGSTYGGFYTQEDIKEIVAYAKSRFINIVPEIEMPGHSLASLASYPENSCTGGPFEVTNIWGVHKDIYCAGRDSTFLFLQNILDEVVNLFPGKYIHIGGDEAPKDRWKVCPKCQARIKAEGLKNEEGLQSYFIKRISNYINSKGKEVIGWDEILQGGLAPGAIVQSWQSFQGAVDAANQNHYSICSPTSNTYLDSSPENLDLQTAYSFNPIPSELPADKQKYILGSEVNLWTERAPQETVDSKLFPRILALAEVFWRNPQSTDGSRNYDEFYSRVQKAYSDLSALGIKYGSEGKLLTTSTSYNEKKKEFTLSIKPQQKDVKIRYTINGEAPTVSSRLYSRAIKFNKTSVIQIGSFKDNQQIGKQYSLSFAFHKALNSKITLANQYDERYKAGGANALVDGIRGTNDFRDGLWQGYEGVDFECVLDIGKPKEISKVTSGFFQDENSWIFLPVKVEVSLSTDNINYTASKTVLSDVPLKNPEILHKDFTVEFDKQKVRYIKIKAANIKKCPAWHPGAGGKAWLFIDEIVVD